jgi:hypothetical protein
VSAAYNLYEAHHDSLTGCGVCGPVIRLEHGVAMMMTMMASFVVIARAIFKRPTPNVDGELADPVF